jgi:hypothetical protein
VFRERFRSRLVSKSRNPASRMTSTAKIQHW